MAHGGACLLGIDVGTSTVKAVLIERGTFRVIQERSKKLGPHAQVDIPSAYERSVGEIFSCLESCIGSFDPSSLQRVSSIGVCGQMHGCTLWKGAQPFFLDGQLQCTEAGSCTNLVTWQNGRCTQEFLTSPSLPQTKQAIPVRTGYGCATLAWLQKNRSDVLWTYDRAGTIMDLIVFALCGDIGKVTMSAQNAASWGYFNIHDMEWESELLVGADFPVHLLPEVVQAPCTAGYLQMDWHGIPEATPVGVAMGDLQCSIFAAQPKPTDAVFNIGSASQLAIIKPMHVQTPGNRDNAPSNPTLLPSSVMEVPYFRDNHLIVAASLAGGNVIASFVTMLYGWLAALGVECQESDIYTKLISCAEGKTDTSLQVVPTLWGERHMPQARGSVSNIGPDNLTLGDTCSAMFRGIVENLRQMMPAEIFEEHQIQRMLGSGQTLQRNPVLQHHTKHVFGLPLVISERPVDAPLGAAMAVQSLLSRNPEKREQTGHNRSTVCTVL